MPTTGLKLRAGIRCISPFLICVFLLATTAAVAQQRPRSQPQPPPPPPQKPPQPPQQKPEDNSFSAPLAGLTAAQRAAFETGQEEFREEETAADGLGPIFNRNSCAACHSGPAVGGSSPISATRFGRTIGSTFDPLESLGGSLLQERSIKPEGIERIPKQANVTALRQTTPLFGLGLIEAIPEATILKGVRTKPVDGVLGKASLVQDVATGKTLVGRFGWKAQQATLLAFAGDAYLNEMGITNRLFPQENTPNGNAVLLKKLDRVADPEDRSDPETGRGGIDALADFMRFLAPLPTEPTTISTGYGAKFFLEAGCQNCHTPMMTTGSNSVSALHLKTVMLYSDLLLHDMGKLGDGIGQGSAGVRDMKTPPLWGVRVSGPYLHDGRARTLDDAIRAHDGEGRVARDRYLKLTREQQQLLVQFLESL